MNITNTLDRFTHFDFDKAKARLERLFDKKMLLVSIAAGIVMLFLSLTFFVGPRNEKVFEHINDVDFQSGRIIDDRESSYFYGKEKALSQKTAEYIAQNAKLEARVAQLEKGLSEKAQPSPVPSPVAGDSGAGGVGVPQTSPAQASGGDLRAYPATSDFSGAESHPLVGRKFSGHARVADLLSFPVKSDLPDSGVMLPAGSYVKAKILTGVEVPEGKTYPVLMVLDYSYVAPNDRKIDLSGCFMIAKAEGDLSTERVQMQPTKMSCVSKKGRMFEREITGFVADDKDGSFAMKGVVNSKQGRVASMAFLASVVDGVGKAVQAAQSTNTVNPLGGSQSVLTGSQATAAVAGGASSAASMVAQWYLQQAQNLSPTVAVGSGRTVWIVVNNTVKLPEEFFRKEKRSETDGVYSYLSRVVD